MSAELVIASIAVFLFGTGAVVFGIKLLAGRNRRPVARDVFTCPACGSHAFGSVALSDGTHTRRCKGWRQKAHLDVRCTFQWHESQDCLYMGEIGARLAAGDPTALRDGGGYDPCQNCGTSRAMHGADGTRSRCPDGWSEPGLAALEQRPWTNADAGGDAHQRDTFADHAEREPAVAVLEQFEVAAETFCHQCDRPLVPRSQAFVLGGGVFLCSRQCALHKLPSGYELREERDTLEDPPGPDELEQRKTLKSADELEQQRSTEGRGFVPRRPEDWQELERLVDDAETCVSLRGGSVEGASAPLARRIRSLLWPSLRGAQ
ncbi:hypothetical protein [Polyangium mundeleinium]|uniref:Uncharacterized protein n=1 Tax=Polyangium mundeleinium TaxID=2995306 RepID=A0ABT5EHA0_9BACT|nr:hypothetical protein [Polyangium mundeleinium]MDC0740126.1 hypothetical protein [Polyangium mundeleinium]